MLNLKMDHPSGSPSPRDDSTSAFDQAVQVAFQGSKVSQTITKREHLKLEDLVLKRCWLARYWGLAAKLGVYHDIASTKYAVWKDLAPLPNEVVISAGLKASSLATKQRATISISSVDIAADADDTASDEFPGHPLSTIRENHSRADDEGMTPDGRQSSLKERHARCEESGSIDTQLVVVEEGLRELVDRKVEDAVLLKISQNQNPTLIWFGLSSEQVQDIRFKQAWLLYYWWRTRESRPMELDVDVAMERLVYWVNQTTKPATYEHAVNVQRGMVELRTLRIDSLDRINGHACGESVDESPHSSPTLSETGANNFPEDSKQRKKF